jgi:uncharacterized protein YqjF (DUF2071 family)
VTVEEVTPTTTRPVRRSLLVQRWADLTFLHWPVDPALVAPLLPAGCRPDLLDGRTYVGLIAFRMEGVGFFRGPGVPYFGDFCETNVRLYSVDANGHRAVVFLSLDAERLLPVLIARAWLRLPYMWSRMRLSRQYSQDRERPVREHNRGRPHGADSEQGGAGRQRGGPQPGHGGNGAGDVLTYTSRRRWPGPRGARSSLSVRVGDAIAEPTPLEHFLTARWGLHTRSWGRRIIHLPNDHPQWSLHRAELVSLDDELVPATGLPAPSGPPVSVLYSPGVPVIFGKPLQPYG